MNSVPLRPPLTRIVATVGPASESADVIERMIRAGVTTFRLNFSHGNHDRHEMVYRRIRELAARLERPTTILQDLQGPKLRIGDLENDEPFEVMVGDVMRICTHPVRGTRKRISTSYADLGKDVRAGDHILIDDGLIEVLVIDVEQDTDWGDEVVACVVHGGLVKPQKGINLPGTNVSAPAMTSKDIADLEFGVQLGVDMVALSFVRSPLDVIDAKRRIRELGGSQPLISKIEKPQAVQALESIVDTSDGLMVARGDLGVELSTEQVPLVQKRLIRLANQAGKPVITATQMLESMIENPRPTRAEASDIANAILDGTDAVMLSGETAVGKWPVRTVETMAQIARTIECDPSWHRAMRTISSERQAVDETTVSSAIAYAAASLAKDVKATAVVVLTASGLTAERVSQQRPGMPILAFADRPEVAARLSLWHGIVPVHEPLAGNSDELHRQIDHGIRRLGYASTGDKIVTVGRAPHGENSTALFLQFHELG
ncbi:MAG: pyruvate kinase [Chloroflexota bacterium]|nr:pyruvate kinase [Chloroflexota bacterium]